MAKILVVDDEESIRDLIKEVLSTGDHEITLAADGNELVYGTRYEAETGLRIRDLKTGEEHWLKYPVQRDDQESLFTRDFMPSYAFTPDGKDVIAAWGGKIHRISVATGEDHEIPFTAQVSRDLGPDLNVAMRVEDGPVQMRLIQQPVQFGPVPGSARRLLAKDALAPCRFERGHLNCGVLVIRRDAGVADQHCANLSPMVSIKQQCFATRQPA